MKIGVISDTHMKGHDGILDQINDHQFHDVDLIMHAGDLVDPSVLTAFGRKEVVAVYGNADPLRVRELLSNKRVLVVNGFRLGLIHDPLQVPREEEVVEQFGPLDCLIFGHTHQPINRSERGRLYFNPGSATRNRYVPFNSVGVLNIGSKITGEIIEV